MSMEPIILNPPARRIFAHRLWCEWLYDVRSVALVVGLPLALLWVYLTQREDNVPPNELAVYTGILLAVLLLLVWGRWSESRAVSRQLSGVRFEPDEDGFSLVGPVREIWFSWSSVRYLSFDAGRLDLFDRERRGLLTQLPAPAPADG